MAQPAALKVVRRRAALGLSAVLLAVLGIVTPVGATIPTCLAAAGGHRVALVIEHGTGSQLVSCVWFSGDTISGADILKQSGVEYATTVYGGLGAAVCQIDAEPATYPPSCWTASSPYWTMFVARDGGPWTLSSLGITAQVFRDGDAEGFRYESQASGTVPPTAAGRCPPSPSPTAPQVPAPTASLLPVTTPAETSAPTGAPTRAPVPSDSPAVAAPSGTGSLAVAPTGGPSSPDPTTIAADPVSGTGAPAPPSSAPATEPVGSQAADVAGIWLVVAIVAILLIALGAHGRRRRHAR